MANRSFIVAEGSPARCVSEREKGGSFTPRESRWNYEGYVGDVRGVDVAVRRLREKLEDDPAQPKYIITRRGAGYYFQKDL